MNGEPWPVENFAFHLKCSRKPLKGRQMWGVGGEVVTWSDLCCQGITSYGGVGKGGEKGRG